MSRVGVHDLHAKRCLITGAASGIGRATAFAAAAKGAELLLTDVDDEGLQRVATELERAAARRCVTPRRRTSPTTTRSWLWARRSSGRTAASTS